MPVCTWNFYYVFIRSVSIVARRIFDVRNKFPALLLYRYFIAVYDSSSSYEKDLYPLSSSDK